MADPESGEKPKSDEDASKASTSDLIMADVRKKLRLEIEDTMVLEISRFINPFDLSTLCMDDVGMMMKKVDALSTVAAWKLVGFVLWWEQQCKKDDLKFAEAFMDLKEGDLRVHTHEARRLLHKLLDLEKKRVQKMNQS